MPTDLDPARQLLASAITSHRSGDFASAECRYLQLLKLEPENFDANHSFGILRAQQGRNTEALSLIGRAVGVNPNSAMALQSQGNVLHAIGRHNDALASYEKSLSIAPASATSWSNRGNALLALKRFQEALESYEKALSLAAEDPVLLNNQATALVALRRPEQAVQIIQQVLAKQPSLAEAHNNLGNALKELKRVDEALASYARAVELRPNYAKALSNGGLVLFEAGRLDEALTYFDRALAASPHYAEALNGRGNTLLFLERFDEAIRDYEAALVAQPDHPWAPNGLADAALKACDWPRTNKIRHDLELHIVDSRSVINPFTLLGYRDEPQLQLECAQTFLRDRIPQLPKPLEISAARAGDRIRIAYLSADFRTHPVASLIAELLERHDRSRFDILGFSFGKDDRSDMRARLMNAVDEFHDVRSNSDLEVAELLRDEHIDIAVDLTGYTHDARPGILAHRPAPVQACYLGFPATTAAPFIDYIIADKTVLPFSEQRFYSEQIVHLPDSYMATDSSRRISDETPTRQQLGLPEQGFVFCCFNSNYKITYPLFEIWMRLLHAVDSSVLWLAQANPTAANNLISAAQRHGIAPDRLIFAPRVPRPEDHLARYRAADLFLDTLPFNAHTTAGDALWAGLPLLTCQGGSFCGRVASSLLLAVGLPELVTNDLAQYEETGRKLANNPPLLPALRARLQRDLTSSALFDGARFRGNLESAYTTMWKHYKEGHAPRGFAV
jgi:predicted O-linked N-acetylglucosamine transferase (SPINDLY family)